MYTLCTDAVLVHSLSQMIILQSTILVTLFSVCLQFDTIMLSLSVLTQLVLR